jgi:microcystin degradation protein MlrC
MEVIMRIALAQVFQETHTFSPLPTGPKEFEHNGLYFGDDILEKMPGVGEIGGYLAAAEEAGGVDTVPIIRAWAMSGGRITTQASEFLEQQLVTGLQRILPVDGIFLSMHGATASEKVDDVVGSLAAAVRRQVGNDLPIVLSLDHHANITRRIIGSVNALVGYQALPHDPFETGERAARLLFAMLKGGISPRIAWQKIPMLAPPDRGHTAEPPMKEWFDLARRMEQQPGVVSASTFPVQPWLDVEELGWSAVVVTDNDPGLARRLAAQLANKAWEMRKEFWAVRRVSPAEVIRQAAEAAEGPVIIADASDSVLSGAPGDSTCLLKEMLEQRITCTALLPMVDREAVEAAIRAGVGQEITVMVGGKLDHVFGQPLKITARVVGLAAQGLTTTSPWGTAEMGRTALLEMGSIKLLVSELRGYGGADPGAYRYFGLEPAQAQLIVVKMYFNFAGLRPIMKGSLMADCPGLSGWDLRKFTWRKAPRPIFPLDELSDWHADG